MPFIIKALGNDYNFKIFSKNILEDNFFDDVDIVAVPGGFGDASSFDRLFQHNITRIQEFVRSGGGYLGIMVNGLLLILNQESYFLILFLVYLKNQVSIILMKQVFYLINKENYLEKIKFIVQHHLNLKTLLTIGMIKN